MRSVDDDAKQFEQFAFVSRPARERGSVKRGCDVGFGNVPKRLAFHLASPADGDENHALASITSQLKACKAAGRHFSDRGKSLEGLFEHQFGINRDGLMIRIFTLGLFVATPISSFAQEAASSFLELARMVGGAANRVDQATVNAWGSHGNSAGANVNFLGTGTGLCEILSRNHKQSFECPLKS